MALRRTRILVVGSLLCALLPLGCAPGEPAASGPRAARCAALVAHYLGVPAVEVTRAEGDPGSARVGIDYRLADRDGTALCRFEEGPGALRVSAAIVDDNRLRDDQLAAFNASR